ncbi:MAG: DNA alkylation repair protein [Candidatus Omnitrophica bacterium]|nr:DNA alkylation repair protein [Candidatus Omnitrophota bacterium]
MSSSKSLKLSTKQDEALSVKAAKVKRELKRHSSKQKAKILQNFFKTGPGQYGEGDIFLGVKVPQTRSVAKRNQDLSLSETLEILKSPIHEERLLALLIFIMKYNKGNISQREKIFKVYLNNTKFINNWDLVDLSAPNIVGDFLKDKDKRTLYKLARSKSLWQRRVSIVATLSFIRNNKFEDTLKIAKILLSDKHDLIHKACGWMLREVGKRDKLKEEEFLKRHYKTMPRVMLRYAIEKFPEKLRLQYLKGRV